MKQSWQHDYGEKWDESDVNTLLHLYNDTPQTVLAIAGQLGRSESAIRSKLYRLKKQGVRIGG